MIIRRMAEAIRTQNWFTVIVEIFIVVIGIFLGLQVSEWNDERQEQQQQHRYQLSFKSDLQSEMADIQSRIVYQALQAERVSYVREVLGKEALPDEAISQEIIIALYLATFEWVASVSDITVSELISSGKLHLIGDLSFRKDVQSFYRRYGTTQTTRRDNDDYRVLVRSIIPPELQQAITDTCNNFRYDRAQIEARFGKCDVDFSNWDAQELVREIQSRSSFKSVLTYHQSFLVSQVGWAKSMLMQLSELSDQLDAQSKALP